MPDEFNEAVALAEMERLREKQAAIDDEDIRLALQDRIDSLESEVIRRRKAANAPQEAETPTPKEQEPELVPATPQQVQEADKLIRQSKVERMRGNGSRAASLMQEAAKIAPNSPTVLEAYADDLFDRKQYTAAREAYKKARRVAPKDVNIETKLAKAAVMASGMGSIDYQLRAALSDSPLLSTDEATASLGVARTLSAFLPGAGQIVLGKNTLGIGLLCSWLCCLGWLVFMKADFSAFFRMLLGKPEHPNMVILLPIFGALVVYISSLGSLAGGKAKGPARAGRDRPAPPVDLPFE